MHEHSSKKMNQGICISVLVVACVAVACGAAFVNIPHAVHGAEDNTPPDTALHILATDKRGDVVSEGTRVIGSSIANLHGYTGKNVKIAVIDRGFDVTDDEITKNIVEHKSFRADGEITGDDSRDTRHGTSVAAVIVDVAPDSKIYLYNVDTSLELIDLVDYIIGRGDIDIISMSLGLLNNVGSADGTTPFAKKVDEARNGGILWVNAAGNSAQRHWQGQFSDSDGDGWHNFSSDDEAIDIEIDIIDVVTVFLSWDDTEPPSQNFDVCLTRGNRVISCSENPNLVDPVDEIGRLVSGDNVGIAIKKVSATRDVNFQLFSSTHDFTQHGIPSSSITIPADAAGSMTVGARYWVTDVLARYSSQGPTLDGRIKPDITAPTGIRAAGYSSLHGTSLAAPYVAGAAALVMEKYPAATSNEIQTLLESMVYERESKSNQDGTGRLDVTMLAHSDILALDNSNPDCEPCFFPPTLHVPIGDTVTWVNADQNSPISIRSDQSSSEQFGSGLLDRGESYTRIFDENGTFGYSDDLHSWTNGQIVVQGQAPTSISPHSSLALYPGNETPVGIAFANGKFWVANNGATDDGYGDGDRVYAYGSDGTHDPDSGFDLYPGNDRPKGIDFANGKFWVLNDGYGDGDRVYAYGSDGTHDPDSGFALDEDNSNPEGITFANGKFWVLNDGYGDQPRVYAYGSDGTHDPDSGFDLDVGNTSPTDIAFTNGKFWIPDSNDDWVFEYNLDGTYDLASGFVLDDDNNIPTGITFANGKFWVANSSYGDRNKVYAYGSDGTHDPDFGFALEDGNNHPYQLTFANNKFWVLDNNWRINERVYAYDLYGVYDNASGFALDDDNNDPDGITFANGKFWVVNDGYSWRDNERVYAYGSDGTHDPDSGFALDEDNSNPEGITFANGKFWVVNDNDNGSDRVHAYDPNNISDLSTRFTLYPGNSNPAGITFANGKFWIVDNEDKSVYPYNLNGEYVPNFGFTLDEDNSSPYGITFANGKFWVTDYYDEVMYPYNPKLTLISAQVTDSNTITLTFSDTITTTPAAFTNLQLTPGGDRTIESVMDSGSTTTITFGGSPVTTDATATLDVGSGITDSVENEFEGRTGVVVSDGQSPRLANVSLSSSNADDSIAASGDTITLAFTASEPIALPTVMVNGSKAMVLNTASNSWNATRIIMDEDPTGMVAFTIDYEDMAGNSGNRVMATTDGTAVYVKGQDLRSTIEELRTMVNTISSRLANLESSINSLTARVTALESGSGTPPPPEPMTGVKGKIYTDTNSNNMLDPGERGRAGIEVITVSLTDHSDVERLRTDANGDFTFERNAGGYLLQAIGGGPNSYAYITIPNNTMLVQNLAY